MVDLICIIKKKTYLKELPMWKLYKTEKPSAKRTVFQSQNNNTSLLLILTDKNMKKLLYIFISFLVFNLATAQQEISTAYATQVNAMFAPLDKTKVPNGILLDFGFEYTNIKAFNGTPDGSDISHNG